jgi:hypothetical protein
MTTADWIQISVGAVLTLTLLVLLWYAWQTRRQANATEALALEARRQAESTERIAESSFRPILAHWIERTPANNADVTFRYWNIGLGPALNIEWNFQGRCHGRVSMAPRDRKDEVHFDLDRLKPFVLVATYNDLHNKRWESGLELELHNDMLDNGKAWHSETRSENAFREA